MKKIPTLLNFFIFLPLLFVSCASDVPDRTGTILGKVVDSKTGQPLKNVSIALTPQGGSKSTGDDGSYIFQDLDPISYTITANRADYQSAEKTVTLSTGQNLVADFNLVPANGNLEVSPTSLDFGNSSTVMVVELTNTGEAALQWKLTEKASWLACNPTSGTIETREKASVVVTVAREGLDNGSYSDKIAISSNAGSAEVDVIMRVEGINLKISPEELDFGPTTTALTLSLTNTSGKNVIYSLEASNDWIQLSKKTGSFTSTDIVVVSVDRSGLSYGDHAGTIKLNVGKEIIQIPVRMNIPEKNKPVVTTIAASDETFNTVNLHGAIISVGSSKVTRHGFCLSTAPEPTVSDLNFSLGDSEHPKDFYCKATSLSPSTTYYVRAYAENLEGLSYGEQLKFETMGTPRLATVITGAASSITDSSVEVSGLIEDLGNLDEITQYGHVWSTNSNPTMNNNKTEFGRAVKPLNFTSKVSGLQPSTTYHVRAYAVNEKGVSYGDAITVRTLSSNEIKLEDYGDDKHWIP